MNYKENILKAIGGTPLVKLNKVADPDGALLLAKCEFMNPAGSIKDRMALHILEKAERAGVLKPGGVIVENTSGNTGLGVAMAAAVKGYKCIFTMPDKMSKEKVDSLKAFGAEVIVTPTNVPADSPESYYETAKRIARETPGSFYLNQYHNPDNIEAHYVSTGPEIYEQCEGRLDAFVAGIGTGGTMSGAGKYMHEKNRAIRNVGVDPLGSLYYGYFKTQKLGSPHVYKVEGIGEDMLCKAMDFTVMDDVRQVDDKQSFTMARRLAREEGLFAGGSSGAAVHVGVQIAREMGRGKTVVVVLPDSGARYISKFYSDEWMKDMGFMEPQDRFGTVRDMLAGRKSEIITARAKDTARVVVDRMKEFGISQMPVVDDRGMAVGVVTEVDLLSFLLEGRHKLEEAISPVVEPLRGVVTPETPVSRLKEVLARDPAAMVKEGERIVAVITKIDVIDWLGARA